MAKVFKLETPVSRGLVQELIELVQAVRDLVKVAHRQEAAKGPEGAFATELAAQKRASLARLIEVEKQYFSTEDADERRQLGEDLGVLRELTRAY